MTYSLNYNFYAKKKRQVKIESNNHYKIIKKMHEIRVKDDVKKRERVLIGWKKRGHERSERREDAKGGRKID